MEILDAALSRELRGLIVENLMFGQGDGLFTDDDSLIEKGLIDSTSVLELVQILENRYSIKVEDDDLVPENLDSINNIRRFIGAKLELSQGAGGCS
ncbi:MAG TPA: acyl carrier protein [Bryobacteraceae bacterium]|nr:acyl carrier protein [Bryobacteraceae bacterium]